MRHEFKSLTESNSCLGCGQHDAIGTGNTSRLLLGPNATSVGSNALQK